MLSSANLYYCYSLIKYVQYAGSLHPSLIKSLLPDSKFCDAKNMTCSQQTWNNISFIIEVRNKAVLQ